MQLKRCAGAPGRAHGPSRSTQLMPVSCTSQETLSAFLVKAPHMHCPPTPPDGCRVYMFISYTSEGRLMWLMGGSNRPALSPIFSRPVLRALLSGCGKCARSSLLPPMLPDALKAFVCTKCAVLGGLVRPRDAKSWPLLCVSFRVSFAHTWAPACEDAVHAPLSLAVLSSDDLYTLHVWSRRGGWRSAGRLQLAAIQSVSFPNSDMRMLACEATRDSMQSLSTLRLNCLYTYLERRAGGTGALQGGCNWPPAKAYLFTERQGWDTSKCGAVRMLPSRTAWST